MNRAQRYSGITLFFTVILSMAFGIFLEHVVVRSNRKPEIRTVVQSQPAFQVRVPAGAAHATASMTAVPATEADGILRRLALRATCVPERSGVVTYAEVEGCLNTYLDFLNARVQTALRATSNREGQPGAVTPQPYVLHPSKTPLKDPTQDAYYKALLREGRFPTTGSDPGRPR